MADHTAWLLLSNHFANKSLAVMRHADSAVGDKHPYFETTGVRIGGQRWYASIWR